MQEDLPLRVGFLGSMFPPLVLSEYGDPIIPLPFSQQENDEPLTYANQIPPK